jgi:hypothetical protein
MGPFILALMVLIIHILYVNALSLKNGINYIHILYVNALSLKKINGLMVWNRHYSLSNAKALTVLWTIFKD